MRGFRRCILRAVTISVVGMAGIGMTLGLIQYVAGKRRLLPALERLGQGPAARPALRSLDGVDRALIRAATNEIAKLERRLTFLATTASVTPFIGLFGTVVGIMIAFQRIGATGSTNLAVVAPGISEALVATAAGLFAAIPALVFYNHFTHRVKELSATMDDFALEFLNIAERNFT